MSDTAQPSASTSLKQQTAALTSTEAAVLASATESRNPGNPNPNNNTTTTTATTNPVATDLSAQNAAAGGLTAAAAASAAELARTKISLMGALRRFPDFPIPGINFIDILPLFQDPAMHTTLLRALELQVMQNFGPLAAQTQAGVTAVAAASSSSSPSTSLPDVIVGLEARGFLFGPSLALRLNASFVPVRKRGKMPGPCVTAAYEKEYGTDYFQMQEGAVKPGQKVLVVDDIIATGGSAAAAASLVKQLGGELLGYLFILEIPFLKGREKLDGLPTVTLLETDD